MVFDKSKWISQPDNTTSILSSLKLGVGRSRIWHVIYLYENTVLASPCIFRRTGKTPVLVSHEFEKQNFVLYVLMEKCLVLFLMDSTKARKSLDEAMIKANPLER